MPSGADALFAQQKTARPIFWSGGLIMFPLCVRSLDNLKNQTKGPATAAQTARSLNKGELFHRREL